MSAAAPSPGKTHRFARGVLPLLAILAVAAVVYLTVGRGVISLEALVRHRAAIDGLVMSHLGLAVLAYIGLYAVAVAVSLPGATFLTVAGGFLFGLPLGAAAAVTGATLGATIIFLVARSALGEPLLKRAGPRAVKLAEGFRADAFNYLLFLRLVPAFPFFLVNLVPAFAGVRLVPFLAATVLGIIPGAVAYAFAGTGLDSVIAAQKNAYDACIAAGHAHCHLTFDAAAILTPQLIGALAALALLALVPVIVKRLRARARAPSADF
ncbi:MAG TPA: VTT domain-containing protein [Pseudolabrys sp.]|nr:VTT domain-containing protein [Pseudolabrys sp.]